MVDYSEDEENTNVYGVLSLPSGEILASRGNELIKIGVDRTVESVVKWDANPVTEAGEPNPEYALSVGVLPEIYRRMKLEYSVCMVDLQHGI